MDDMTAAEVQEKIEQGKQEAEQKVQTTIETVQNSKLGRYLPTEIREVTIKDIVKLLIFTIFANTMPLYFIFSGTWPKYISYLSYIFSPAFVILSLAQFFLGIILYITCIQDLHIFLTIATVLKSALNIVLISIFEFKFTFLRITMIFSYLFWITGVDVAFLYYIAIYLDNENSKTLDEHGVEKTQGKEKV